MTGLKRYMYRFLVGLLIFGLLPLRLSAQEISDEDAIIVEMIRPPMDSVDNIKEYTFEIIKDKETNEMVVIVYDDDGTPFKRTLSSGALKDLGYIEDVRDLHHSQIIGVDRLPDGSLILSYEDDDGIVVKQEITLDDALALGFVESEDEDVESEDEVVESEDELVESEDEVVESEDELNSNSPENQKGSGTPDGIPVPKTATAIYNYLALGALLFVVGTGLYIKQRKGD